MRELFKDEVRELGVALGLDPSMIYRHPFPGPGLGVRANTNSAKDLFNREQARIAQAEKLALLAAEPFL